MSMTFEGPVVVPMADPEDASRTAEAVLPYLEADAPVIVVYVVEKAGGAPDKAPMEQLEGYAADIFDHARPPLEAAGIDVETEVRYDEDIVEGIFEAAIDHDAGAVAFVPRESNRLVQLLTGDVARRLLREASVPVVGLPGDSSGD